MTSKKKRGIALALMLSGFIVLPTVLAAYAISHFIIATQLGGGETSGIFMNLILSVMGIVGVLLILVGIPVGIVMFVHANKDLARELRGQEPYRSMPEDQFQFLMKPSWGAFFHAPVWAFCNKLYVWGLVALFVPIGNLYAWLRLFADGRRLAWATPGWQSFEQFKRRQKIAAWIIVAILILSTVVLPLLMNFAVRSLLNARYMPLDPANGSEVNVLFGEQTEEQQQKVDEMKSSLKASICSRYLDPDADGLPNGVEKQIGTNGDVADTDGDGYKDLDEIKGGYDPLQTLAADVDGDGVSDAIERYVWLSDYTKADTDSDGQTDLEEVKAGTAPAKTGHVPTAEFLAVFAQKNADALTKNECE